MTKIEATQAQENFSELISRVESGKERIVIEQEGQAIAAVISYADLKRLEALEDDRDIALIQQAKAKNEEFITVEEVIEGYNKLHRTDLTIERILND
jgi:prevent-host-death family protein